MVTTVSNTKNVNRVKPLAIKIVNTLPDYKDAKIGEIFLLISDGHADDKKIHIRVVAGWIKTAALS